VHLFPATLFVAGAAADRWRRRAELESRERIAYDFGLAWLALGLAMLTLASTKRAIYLLPIFPAAAIAAGVWLDRFLDGRADGAFDRLVGHLMSASLLAAAIALLTAAFFIEGPPGCLLSPGSPRS
jgi:4-amino-4-deoxy-L-arabinose transferase-like glycosyltransferase